MCVKFFKTIIAAREKNDQQSTPKLTPPQTAYGNRFWKCLHSGSYGSADISAVVYKTGEGLLRDDNELRKALARSRGQSNEPVTTPCSRYGSAV